MIKIGIALHIENTIKVFNELENKLVLSEKGEFLYKNTNYSKNYLLSRMWYTFRRTKYRFEISSVPDGMNIYIIPEKIL